MNRSIVLAMSLSGCVGVIESPPSTEAPFEPPAPVGCELPQGPGRVVLHRLNRTEYNNTVRDLLGDLTHPADDFPPDDANVFDNDAAALAVSPLLLEKLDGAAEALAARAVESGLITCDSATLGVQACARSTLEPLMVRAWRRPVSAAELDRAVAIAADVDPADPAAFRRRIELALHGVLLAPSFLYRAEVLEHPDSLAPQRLDAYALASRLSYFLWSSTPDDALLAAAASGALVEPAGLEAQVRRMLADDRSRALTDGLADQWLLGRTAGHATPDPVLYPLDDALREGLRAETRALVAALLIGDTRVTELLDGRFTFVNARVARHYGLEGAFGDGLTRIALDGSAQRGGLLTHGSVHVATSHSKQTSVVRRGKFVLENLLCQHIAAPPPNAEATQAESERMLPPDAPRKVRDSVRTEQALCAGCHTVLDPIGFSMEHYDVVGAWRDDDGPNPVDATGTLPGTGSFDGALELGAGLAADPRFTRCLTEKLFTYALGRTLTPAEQCTVQQVTDANASHGHRLRDLVLLITQTPQFTHARGETP